MRFDCAIVGGGPAGLNAALVLGRARKHVALFDNNQPRNRVTHASHGFITRDGVQPEEFRRIAYEEVLRYPSVRHSPAEVREIRRTGSGFGLLTASGDRVEARKLILSLGLREVLPNIEGIRDFYGRSVFNCPFCDGWELREQPLALISEHPGAFHKIKLLSNWTRDIVVCTNGSGILSVDQRRQLESRSIRVVDTPIARLTGTDGNLERVHFIDGRSIARSGGFIDPQQIPNAAFEYALGYKTTRDGGIITEGMGQTTAKGVFAAGDSAYIMPSQLIYAAASGSRAAMGVMAELMEEDWGGQN